MTFFYDLNKKIAALAGTQLNEGKSAKPDFLDVDKDGDKKEPFKKAVKDKELDEASYSAKSARAGKDIGKPGKAFGKIAADAAERYGSKEKGEKVAGAVLKKLRAKEGVEEAKAKPDYIDLDKDGNRKETMKKAAADKKKNAFDPEVARSMFSPEKGKTKTGHEVKDTGYSKRYTKKLDDQPEDKEDDDTPKTKGRKTVGVGKGKKIGAKVKGTSKLHSKGAIAENDHEMISLVDKGEYDREGNMAKKDLKSIAMAAKELHAILGDDQNLPEWVQSKITKALDYINASNQYMHQEMGDEEVAEVAPPGAKAERMVKHIKKSLSKDGKLSDKDKAIAYATTWKAKKEGKVEEESDAERDDHAERAGKKVAKDIEYDEGHKGKDDNKAEKAGKKVAKDIEYDEKVKESDTPKKSKGGIQFGKGVYEAMNDNLEKVISESMNVNVSMSTNDAGEPTKSITVSAEGEQAEMLAQLLNLAGLQGKAEACPSCGSTPCGCDQVDEAVDENNPDWPTDEETTGNDDPQQRRWAGGLNGPKSTGQTTGAPFNRQPERQGHMAEAADLGLNLYAELKSFKAK